MQPSSLPLNAVYRVVCDIDYRPLGTAFAYGGDGVLLTAAHVGAELKTCRLLVDRGDRKPWRTGFLGKRDERGVAWVRPSDENVAKLMSLQGEGRAPVEGEEVFVIGYPCPEERADWKLYAAPRVCRSSVMAQLGQGDSRRIELQGAFPRGFSGAPILALSDGALLGMLDAVGFAPLMEEKGIGFHLGLAVPTDLLALAV